MPQYAGASPGSSMAWHPIRGIGRQLPGVTLQLGQILKRVGAAQLTAVNQRHK